MNFFLGHPVLALYLLHRSQLATQNEHKSSTIPMEIDPNAPPVVQLSCFGQKKSVEMVTSNVVLLVWNCPFMNTPFFTLAYIYLQSELTQSQTTFLVVLDVISKLDLNSISKHLKNVRISRMSVYHFHISNFISV